MTNNVSENKTALALGFFDGLHLAHIQVLKKVKQAGCEKGFEPCVLIFDKHPQSVLKGKEVEFLCTKEQRDEILLSLGLKKTDCCFESIKDMTPEEFFLEVLIKKLNVAFVSCGYNYRFGKNGAGTADTLKKLGEKYGVEVFICEKQELDGEAISSSLIRSALKNGDVEKANKMLGRPFSFKAQVFDGDHRGRLLGAPTINQYLPKGLIIPKFGVYASMSFVDGKWQPSVSNIGSRPTFDGISVRSETYIIDYSGDLYGKCVEVCLFDFLREEKKFSDFDELKTQITLDAENALKKLSLH